MVSLMFRGLTSKIIFDGGWQNFKKGNTDNEFANYSWRLKLPCSDASASSSEHDARFPMRYIAGRANCAEKHKSAKAQQHQQQQQSQFVPDRSPQKTTTTKDSWWKSAKQNDSICSPKLYHLRSWCGQDKAWLLKSRVFIQVSCVLKCAILFSKDKQTCEYLFIFR